MWFWVKHLVAATILLALAFVLLFKPELFKTTPSDVKEIKATAAVEFTNFYEQLRYTLDATKDMSKQYIIELPDTSDSLTEQLESRKVLPALEPEWKGAILTRKFKPGDKLRDQMANYAKAENIELIWTLPRDYVVKHYFHSNSDYLSTLGETASAIAPDFETPVLAYFCPNERAAVITAKGNAYLMDNCIHLNAEKPAKKPLPAASKAN
jgi:hypothetical protein